ncbi:BTB/POZ domain-containing protein At5g17580 [Diospyros lotus]|uniref:BTB/POZ domain-containing protein At5g17580 n=1 Tax=Diospyros lotus TaxID=55363 RepID=UPI00224D0CE9|nr:BTB/POZ domain-containing protein At5g17580 [Diospyros lotus]
MATRKLTESSSSSWLPKPTIFSTQIQIRIDGILFTVDRDLLAAKSAKFTALLEENPNEDASNLLRDIPAGPEAFELAVRFCHGVEVKLAAENVVPLTCLAYFLEMTETHSTNNLLKKALTYFEQRILPSWNQSVKALRASESVLQQAMSLGLIDACAETIITKVLANPTLLGEPTGGLNNDDESEDKENVHKKNARRQLFGFEQQLEDLVTLCLQLYKPLIQAMIQRRVPPEYTAASLCQYAKQWVFPCSKRRDGMSIHKRNSQREVIEAVERLLPYEIGIVPCTLFFEMLQSAILLEANSDCREGFEIRIGKQLDKATVKDLLIPSKGYAKEMEYDLECVRRILKNFYCNYKRSDMSGLITVAELVENFLAEVASDEDLKISNFLSLAEMSTSVSMGVQRSSDGIYRAIDIYLDKHSHLTESEKEEVCGVLDCNKMSPEACQHAVQNDRLPLRVVVQLLFVGQLQLRDTITKEVQDSDDRLRKLEAEEEEEMARVSSWEEEGRTEMQKMGSKVMELEKECYMMRKEIQSESCSKVKKQKGGMWRDVKRKFGCMSGMRDCDCHIKKKKVHSGQ